MDAFTLLFDPESLLLDPEDGVRHAMARLAAEWGRDPAAAWATPFNRARDLRAVLADLLDVAPAGHRLDLALVRYRELYLAEGRFHGRVRPDMAAWLGGLAEEPGLTRLYLSHIGPSATLALLDAFELHGMVDRLFVAATALEPGRRACLLRGLLAGAAGGSAAGPALDPARLLLLSDMPHELLLARRLGVAALPLGFGRCDPSLFPDAEVALDAGDVARWVRARLRRWPVPAATRPLAACC